MQRITRNITVSFLLVSFWTMNIGESAEKKVPDKTASSEKCKVTTVDATDADKKKENWNFKIITMTKDVSVASDASREDTENIAMLIQGMVDIYFQTYKSVWNLKKVKLKVYFFEEEDMFRKTMSAVISAAEKGKNQSFPQTLPSAGAYFALAKVIFIPLKLKDSYLGDLERSHIAIHETVHALDDLAAGRLMAADRKTMVIPIWVTEGRAEYFGLSNTGNGILPGNIAISHSVDYVKNLVGFSADPPVKKLLKVTGQEWQRAASVENYALAWAFTHFLIHGADGKYRQKFEEFLKKAKVGKEKKGKSGEEALALFEKIVGETDSLQASFKQHLDQVLIPGALLRRRYYSIVRMALSGGISVEEQAFLNKMAAEWKIPPEEAAKIAKAVETAKTDFILMDSGDPSRDQVTFRDEIKCAWADGEIQPVEKQILSSLLKTVNLSPKELDNMIAAEAPPSVGKKS